MKDAKVDWLQEIWIPAQVPIVSSRIRMQIFDQDQASKEIVGTINFNLEDYVKIAESGGDFPFFWKDIYGAPLKVSGDDTDKMNQDPDYASFWKGRILMQVVAEKTDRPKMQICTVSKESINQCRAALT